MDFEENTEEKKEEEQKIQPVVQSSDAAEVKIESIEDKSTIENMLKP